MPCSEVRSSKSILWVRLSDDEVERQKKFNQARHARDEQVYAQKSTKSGLGQFKSQAAIQESDESGEDSQLIVISTSNLHYLPPNPE